MSLTQLVLFCLFHVNFLHLTSAFAVSVGGEIRVMAFLLLGIRYEFEVNSSYYPISRLLLLTFSFLLLQFCPCC